MVRLISILVFFIGLASYGQRDLLIASRQQVSCDPSASNPNPQLVTGNATAYCDDEANAAPATGGGNGQNNPTGATVASVADNGSGYGDYALEITALDGTSDRNRHYFTVTSGEIYEYRISVRMVTGTSGRFYFFNTTTTESTFFSSTSWAEYTGEVTASSTSLRLEVWAANSGSAGDKSRYKFSLKLKDD